MAEPGVRILHPDLTAEERERLFREGIELFNQGKFFESHEAWEEIWRSTTPEPKELFQGLIQVAAAMHQFLDLKRDQGPLRTLAKARQHLESYEPAALGLDLAGLLRQVGSWQSWLEHRSGEPPPIPVLKECRTAAASPTEPCG